MSFDPTGFPLSYIGFARASVYFVVCPACAPGDSARSENPHPPHERPHWHNTRRCRAHENQSDQSHRQPRKAALHPRIPPSSPPRIPPPPPPPIGAAGALLCFGSGGHSDSEFTMWPSMHETYGRAGTPGGGAVGIAQMVRAIRSVISHRSDLAVDERRGTSGAGPGGRASFGTRVQCCM